MADQPSQVSREQTAAQSPAHEQGVAAQRAREYPNPYADRPASPQRNAPEAQVERPPTAKSLAEAEAREREIVGRDRSGPPIVERPHPMNPYEEYERHWGFEGGRER